VVGESSKGLDLVTAYPIERSHMREKKKKEFEAFSRKRKEGAAV